MTPQLERLDHLEHTVKDLDAGVDSATRAQGMRRYSAKGERRRRSGSNN